MTSQGQRFRRRALRRGYKVDEVDTFLDRVEATLNNERVDSPVRSHEVRDVVFRVRFGGYDEWQVDLHLDRVERQLADQEPAGGVPDRAGERLPERTTPDRIPERLPERIPGNAGMAAPGMGGPGNMPPMGGPGMPPPGLGVAAAFDRDRPPTGVSQRDLPPRDAPMRDDRMMPPPPPPNRPQGPPPGWPDAPQRAAQGGFPPSGFPPSGFPERTPPGMAGPGDPLPQRQSQAQEYGNEPTSFSGFEVGRRERPDMTGEMRVPPGGPHGPQGPQNMPPAAGRPPMGQPPMPHPQMSQPPANQPPMRQPPTGQPPTGQPQMGQPPMGGGPGGNLPPGDVQRIDQLRRTFQLRRFGSGYDRAEVDRLFEGLINTMSGRSTMPINESELDPQQFSLVPGGYFESEVDQALREVRDIIRRR